MPPCKKFLNPPLHAGISYFGGFNSISCLLTGEKRVDRTSTSTRAPDNSDVFDNNNGSNQKHAMLVYKFFLLLLCLACTYTASTFKFQFILYFFIFNCLFAFWRLRPCVTLPPFTVGILWPRSRLFGDLERIGSTQPMVKNPRRFNKFNNNKIK